MSNRQTLLKYTKDLSHLLESVQTNIEVIKGIKDSIPEMDELLRLKEIDTEKKIELFERNITDKKLETITNVAKELGKIVISPIDIEDLVNEVSDLRKSVATQVQEKTDIAVEKFRIQLIHEVRIKELLNEKDIAVLEIKLKVKDNEIQMLKDKIETLQQSQIPFHPKTIHIGKSNPSQPQPSQPQPSQPQPSQ
jgi:hypothetical protein